MEQEYKSRKTKIRGALVRSYILKLAHRLQFSRRRFFISSFPFVGLFLILMASLSLNCSRSIPGNEQAGSQEIVVAAAANLTDAFAELGKGFTARTGVRVTFSFGATADLARQIENSAPFDVFASADIEHVERLSARGLLVRETSHVYASGRLVLWIPPGSSFTLNRLEELTRAEVERIAIAKPDIAPYGRATVEALRALNLWPQVEPKVIYGQNVSQTKQYAATGNAEVAFIPLALTKANEGQIIEVDERLHQPIDQAIAVIKDSPRRAAAERFVSFVLSPEGQALLERYGYKRTVTSDE
jgi:molybdate transport system substrate-binding protein